MPGDLWESMKGKQMALIVLQIVELENSLVSTKFQRLGALYYKENHPPNLNPMAPLFMHDHQNEAQGSKLGIGPANHCLS